MANTSDYMKRVEHNRCLICGRKLKNPKNKERGYGETCYKKLKTQRYRLFEDNK